MSKVKEILKEQLKLLTPEQAVVKKIEKVSKEFKKELEKELIANKILADVFIGGSFAKGTLLRKSPYDIDVFVRFNWKYEDLSNFLARPLEKTCKTLGLELQIMHGSRDYYRAKSKNEFYFEIIPVTKIKRPSEERNVTDLSYFHVPYVKKKIKGKEGDVMLAKTFCHAQKTYGAESYIQGFSGYALECLIIHYKSFEKMLKELSKIKDGEKLVIDIEKFYKRKDDVFFELNENKLHSPVILIDPTYKERNALAALSNETFKRFQSAARKFLKSPSQKYFVEKEINPEEIKRKAEKGKAEFVSLSLKTDRQAGDIAGTKLKKFHHHLEREMSRYFKIVLEEFDYNDEQKSKSYFVVKSKGEIVQFGPPTKMKKHADAFKFEHKNAYEKKGNLYSKIKVNFTAKEFLTTWKRDNKNVMDAMGIIGFEIS